MKVILKDTLKKRHLSQYQLSKLTGITPGNINNLCNNKTSSIQFSVLDKICEVLKCEISDILIPESSSNNVKGDTP